MKVVFVCTGNINRSAAAELLMRRYRPDWDVVSCATNRKAGKPMSKKMRDVLNNLGIDATSHRSKALSSEILRDADMIFGFQPSHLKAITELGFDAIPIIEKSSARYSNWTKVPDPAFDSTGKTHSDVVRFLIDTLERVARA